MVVDVAAPALAGVPGGHVLDALVFSSPEAPPSAVYVAGRLAAAPEPGITEAYVRALQG
jgi:formimidoylglutamate deiminase